jgi:hypothetical protein
MTIERFARRVGATLAFGGLGLIVGAVFCWATIGGGGQIVRSIHMVAGWVLAVFGAVTTASGIAISAAVPSQAGPERLLRDQ